MMLFFCLLAVALGAVSPSDEPQLLTGNCPMFWYSFNGRCYKYVATMMTWADAEINCVSQGGNLVSIHNKGEQDFVKILIKEFDPSEQYTWIGLSDKHKEATWMWSDGSPVKFTFWSPGNPSNYKGQEHCVHTNFIGELRWNDEPCTVVHPFVCAFSDCKVW